MSSNIFVSAMTPSIGLNLRVTGHCNQGGRKYMEDAFVVAYQQSEDQKDLEYAYFGIFDGHGGREAALFAKEHLMNNIVCQKSFWSDDDNQVLKAIRDGFLATHHAMWREVGKWPKTVSGLPSTSGTTSSIAFIRRRKLYIGHVGDSKIVLGFQIPGDLWSYNYMKDEFVVSPDPDVKVMNINPNFHRCVIFASDGLWNMLSTQCAVKIVQAAEEENEKIILEGGKTNGTGKQPNNPSKLLVDAALKHWFELGMRADNTSVVTVMLDPPGPPKSEVLLRQRVMKRLRPRDDQPEEAVEAKNSNSETPSTLVVKEKRKSNEGCESQLNRERKRSSDSTVEMVNKERKLSSEHEESVPKNLPKPVILSPQRVVKQSSPVKPVHRNEVAKSPENVNSPPVPILLMKSKKKTNDPPKGGGSSSSLTAKEGENENREESANLPTAATDKPLLTEGESEASPLSKNVLNDSGPVLVPNASPVKTESFVSKPEKDEASPPKSSNYPISKENGRVHLCEVDNIFKLNERTTECFENSDNSKQSEVSPKNKTVPSVAKNFRKSTITRRNSSFPAVKRPRLHQRTFSSCRTNAPRRSFAHNTRAQSGIRKLKV
ncbi:unnamed protein product [Larinioides sclopetarius]|uniref:PPM-type phosphatase domain-containing protein n=1 Tax=Larinioides sclopetarius TaxID=280406 RepID=A0AAV1ZCX3_9ARAC